MSRIQALFTMLFAAFLFAATPSIALAEEPHGEPTHEAGGHGDDAHGGGHGGGHHIDYSADDDGDGTPNWRDAESEGYVLSDLGSHIFNLFVLFAVLFWAGGSAIRASLRERANDIRKEITEAAQARDEAQHRFDELATRLSEFEDEVAAMKAKAAEESKAQEVALIKRANDEAVRIAQQAEINIRDEVTRARLALREDAVILAVQLAEETLKSKIKADDQKKLAREFLAALNNGVTHG